MRKRVALCCLFLAPLLGWGVPSGSQSADDKAPEHVKDLVEKLGSPKFAEREKATRDLEAIGPAALDLLREAAKSPHLETSRRAGALVNKIEGKLATAAMLAPKRLRLNVKDRDVAEAVAELAKLSGYPIEIGDKAALAGRKVTVDTGDATFWEALAHLCRKAELTELPPRAPGPFSGPGPGLVIGAKKGLLPPVPAMVPVGPGPAIVLADGKPLEVPTHLEGTVRIRALPAAKDAAVPPGEALIVLDVTGEPRLQEFGAIDGLTIDGAVDDQGQTLARVDMPMQPTPERNIFGGKGIVIINGRVIDPTSMSGGARKLRTLPIRFKLGEKPAAMFKELSGTVLVQALKEAEAFVTVDNVLKSAGQTFKGKKEHAVHIHEIEKLPDGGVKVRVTLTSPEASGIMNPFGGGNIVINGGNVVINGGNVVINGVRLGEPAAPRTMPRLVDARGKAYPPAEVSSRGSEATLIYRPEGEPSQLVLFGHLPVTVAVPFSLRDVPLGNR